MPTRSRLAIPSVPNAVPNLPFFNPPRRTGVVKRAPALCLLLGGLLLTACSVEQLQGNTVNVGSTEGSIYRYEVLQNLNIMNNNKNAVPSDFVLAKGTITTENNIQPSISIPYGNTVTRNVVTDTVTQVVAPYQSISLSGSQQWSQSWDITPQPNACAIGVLHDAYLYALGQSPTENDFSNPKKYQACLEEMNVSLPSPSTTQQGGPPIKKGQDPSPTTAGAAAQRKPTALTAADLANADENWASIEHNCGHGNARACFLIEPPVWCGKSKTDTSNSDPPVWLNSDGSPNTSIGRHEWICLGRYGYSLTNMDETLISPTAYDNQVLFHLVLLTIALQPPGK